MSKAVLSRTLGVGNTGSHNCLCVALERVNSPILINSIPKGPHLQAFENLTSRILALLDLLAFASSMPSGQMFGLRQVVLGYCRMPF